VLIGLVHVALYFRKKYFGGDTVALQRCTSDASGRR
jgi:hypothetical protein